MLDEAGMRFAIDDARVRHKALADLIYFLDQQALRLLGLYVSVGLAAAAAAITGFSSKSPITHAAGLALGAASICLSVGCLFCFWTMKPAAMSLPGRDAQFWLWANNDSVPHTEMFEQYLKNLDAKTTANLELNENSAIAFGRAKLCGVLAPLAALGVGVVALLLGA